MLNLYDSVPSLYEKYVNTSTPVVDEWTLTQRLTADNAIDELENHYKTFIVSPSRGISCAAC